MHLRCLNLAYESPCKKKKKSSVQSWPTGDIFKIYCNDTLKRYSYRQIGLDMLDGSVLSLNWVAYAKDLRDI